MNKLQQELRQTCGLTAMGVEPIAAADNNQVYLVDRKFVYKNYTTQGYAQKEFQAMILFSALLGSTSIPMVVGAGTDFLLMEYLSGLITAKEAILSGIVSRGQVEDSIVELWTKTINPRSEGLRSRIKIYRSLSWQKHTKTLQSGLTSKSTQLNLYLTRSEQSRLNYSVSTASTYSIQSMVLNHRDLHLENILVDPVTKSIYLIDFEHSLWAPLEYEFQNSIFWDDADALNFLSLKQMFALQNIVLSTDKLNILQDLYFLDQLLIGLRNKQSAKCRLLVERYRGLVV